MCQGLRYSCNMYRSWIFSMAYTFVRNFVVRLLRPDLMNSDAHASKSATWSLARSFARKLPLCTSDLFARSVARSLWNSLSECLSHWPSDFIRYWLTHGSDLYCNRPVLVLWRFDSTAFYQTNGCYFVLPHVFICAVSCPLFKYD